MLRGSLLALALGALLGCGAEDTGDAPNATINLSGSVTGVYSGTAAAVFSAKEERTLVTVNSNPATQGVLHSFAFTADLGSLDPAVQVYTAANGVVTAQTGIITTDFIGYLQSYGVSGQPEVGTFTLTLTSVGPATMVGLDRHFALHGTLEATVPPQGQLGSNVTVRATF